MKNHGEIHHHSGDELDSEAMEDLGYCETEYPEDVEGVSDVYPYYPYPHSEREFSSHSNDHDMKQEYFRFFRVKEEQYLEELEQRNSLIDVLNARLEELQIKNISLSQQISGIELDRAQNSKQVGLFSLQLNPVKLVKIVQDFEMELNKFSSQVMIHPDNKSRLRTEIHQAMVETLSPVTLRPLQMARYIGSIVYQSLYEYVSKHHPLNNVVSEASKALTSIFHTLPPTSYLRDWYLHSSNAETRNAEVWDPFQNDVFSSVCKSLESIQMLISEEYHPILKSLVDQFFFLFFTVYAMDGEFTFPSKGVSFTDQTMNCDGTVEYEVPVTNGDEPSKMYQSSVLFAATPCIHRCNNQEDVIFSKASIIELHPSSQLNGLANLAASMPPLPRHDEQSSDDEVQMV